MTSLSTLGARQGFKAAGPGEMKLRGACCGVHEIRGFNVWSHDFAPCTCPLFLSTQSVVLPSIRKIEDWTYRLNPHPTTRTFSGPSTYKKPPVNPMIPPGMLGSSVLQALFKPVQTSSTVHTVLYHTILYYTMLYTTIYYAMLPLACKIAVQF